MTAHPYKPPGHEQQWGCHWGPRDFPEIKLRKSAEILALQSTPIRTMMSQCAGMSLNEPLLVTIWPQTLTFTD
jgi:hypothetical protein